MKNIAPIQIEQSFKASVETVWEAITDVNQMQQWYFPNIPDFKTEIDFETRFLIQNEGRNFTHIWKVKEIEPYKVIGYSWNFEEYAGEGHTTFKIVKKDGETLLTLKSIVIEPFPEDILEFKRESGQAGWEYLINQSLVSFLKNKQ